MARILPNCVFLRLSLKIAKPSEQYYGAIIQPEKKVLLV